MGHTGEFFDAALQVCSEISTRDIEVLATELDALRARGGRLFLLGVGGSAANCSHAAADFRKLCGIEAYSAADNVAELTARANDNGWDTIFSDYLMASCLTEEDAVMIFSVGGGDIKRGISVNLTHAVNLAKGLGARVLGIVGRDGGYTAKHGDVVVVVPEVKAAWVTPLSEGFASLVWHCLVSHPLLQRRQTTW